MRRHREEPTRALVTGGGGFVGRYVVERLVAQGFVVRVLVRRPHPELQQPGVELFQTDLADKAAVARACRDVHTVHHVAACVELSYSRDELVRANVEGTRHVIDGCVDAGVQGLVFTSTASVVFGLDDLEGADESVPYPSRFVNAYAETKAAAERMVMEANGHRGLRTTALRPHLVWGPRDTHLIPNIVARARAGNLVQVGDGRNLVSVTYVENLADAHVLAADRLTDGSAAGRVFFISQDEPVEAWTFFGGLLQRLGLPRPSRAISYRRAYAIGAACELAWPLLRRTGPPPMTRFLAAQMAKSHYFDLTAARQVLRYVPRVSTEEGLDRVVAELSAAA